MVAFDKRLELFKCFYEFTYNEQSIFLSKMIEMTETKKRKVTKSQRFKFSIDNFKVCKETLLNTFDIRFIVLGLFRIK